MQLALIVVSEMGLFKTVALVFFVSVCLAAADDLKSSRELTYEDMLEVIKNPYILIIDVRNPLEVAQTGRIGLAINIPLNELADALLAPEDWFLVKYGRSKPSSFSDVVFYCKDGQGAKKATEVAHDMGYLNVFSYPGSWIEWAEKQNIKPMDSTAE